MISNSLTIEEKKEELAKPAAGGFSFGGIGGAKAG